MSNFHARHREAFLEEAGRILRGTSRMIATKDHLRAVAELVDGAYRIMREEGLDQSVRHAEGVDDWFRAARLLREGKPL